MGERGLHQQLFSWLELGRPQPPRGREGSTPESYHLTRRQAYPQVDYPYGETGRKGITSPLLCWLGLDVDGADGSDDEEPSPASRHHIWRPVPDWPGYEVSNMLWVRSLKRVVPRLDSQGPARKPRYLREVSASTTRRLRDPSQSLG